MAQPCVHVCVRVYCVHKRVCVCVSLLWQVPLSCEWILGPVPRYGEKLPLYLQRQEISTYFQQVLNRTEIIFF